MKTKEIKKCSDCGSTSFKEDKSRGELVCRKCGLVVDNMIVADTWKDSKTEEEILPHDTHAPLEKGSYTEFASSNRHESWLLKLQNWSIKSKYKRLENYYIIIYQICQRVGMEERDIMTVCKLYELATAKGFVKGSNGIFVIGGFIHFVSYGTENPLSLKKIARALEEMAKEIGIKQVYEDELGKVFRNVVIKKMGLRNLSPELHKKYYGRNLSRIK